MSLEEDGSLYFQPTVVGSSTNRHHCIRNLSHLPLRLVSVVPQSISSLLIHSRLMWPVCGSLWLFFHDRFQWSIPEPDEEFVFVKPNHGELLPNDSSVRSKSSWKCTFPRPFDSTAYHLCRSRRGHSAHWKRKNTHLNPNSPFGQHRLLDVIAQNSALKWREWAPKV